MPWVPASRWAPAAPCPPGPPVPEGWPPAAPCPQQHPASPPALRAGTRLQQVTVFIFVPTSAQCQPRAPPVGSSPHGVWLGQGAAARAPTPLRKAGVTPLPKPLPALLLCSPLPLSPGTGWGGPHTLTQSRVSFLQPWLWVGPSSCSSSACLGCKRASHGVKGNSGHGSPLCPGGSCRVTAPEAQPRPVSSQRRRLVGSPGRCQTGEWLRGAGWGGTAGAP